MLLQKMDTHSEYMFLQYYFTSTTCSVGVFYMSPLQGTDNFQTGNHCPEPCRSMHVLHEHMALLTKANRWGQLPYRLSSRVTGCGQMTTTFICELVMNAKVSETLLHKIPVFKLSFLDADHHSKMLNAMPRLAVSIQHLPNWEVDWVWGCSTVLNLFQLQHSIGKQFCKSVLHEFGVVRPCWTWFELLYHAAKREVWMK